MVMNDHIKSEISLYLAGNLTESRNRQIEAHTASCEKCRTALTRAKSKNARVKREALKKASSDPLPNLFLARQGKDVGADPSPSRSPFILAGFFLLAGLAFWSARHFGLLSRSTVLPGAESDTAEVMTSTAAATTAEKPPVPKAARSVAPIPAQAKAPVTIPLQQQWKGQESSIPDARVVVIRNKDHWQNIWEETQQKDSLPAINFDDHVVVAVLAGSRPAGSMIELGRIRDEDDDALYIPYRVNAGTTVASGTSDAPVHPFIFAQIPHIQKKIRLIEKGAK